MAAAAWRDYFVTRAGLAGDTALSPPYVVRITGGNVMPDRAIPWRTSDEEGTDTTAATGADNHARLGGG